PDEARARISALPVLARPLRWPGLVRRGVGAEQAVDHAVAPGAVAPAHGPGDALPGEPGLFQGPLLGGVAHVGAGPDPVHGGVREQVAGQQPLRLRAVTVAA